MISIIVFEDGIDITGFSIQGHAKAARYGEDIVCSAVSVLSQSAILGLHHYVGLEVDYKREEGDMICQLPANMDDEQKLQARAILHTMVLGLTNIAQVYSKHISLEKRRCNP